MKRTTLGVLLLLAAMGQSQVILAQTSSASTFTQDEKSFLRGRLHLNSSPSQRPIGYRISGYPDFHQNAYGRAYIHRQVDTSGIDMAILSPRTLRPNANFGFSVDLHDNIALVGAPRGGTMREGETYLFKKFENRWRLMEVLTAPDGEPRDDFGYSVSLAGTLALVAGTSADGNRRNQGAIYVYHIEENGKCMFLNKLEPEQNTVAYFGKYIETYEDLIIVGAEHRKDRRDMAFAYEKIDGVWEERYYFEDVPSLERFMKLWKDQHPEDNEPYPVPVDSILDVQTDVMIGSTENELPEN